MKHHQTARRVVVETLHHLPAELREAAVLCPMDRMLVETDAPFLAPVPHRGRPNEPAHVGIVGTAIADLRGIAPAELAAATSTNALRAFPRIQS